MKVLFLGTLYQQEDENKLLRSSKVGLQNQANSFQWALIQGFDTLLNKSIDLLNVLPVGTYPKQFNKVILKSREWSHINEAIDKEIGSINLPVIKQVTRIIYCRKEIKKWIKVNQNEEDLHIVIYSSYLPFLLAVKSLKQKVKITLIVTDIPEYDDLSKNKSFLNKLARSINNTLIYKSLKNIDNYVLLTEHMKRPLHIKDSPFVIVEGLIDNKISNYNIGHKIDKSKKIILYTGSLTIKLGVVNLLNAFDYISFENYELWICGSGEADELIRERASFDKRIKYFGFVNKKKVYELQQKATVLVNARTNDEEYTKYSFPSKTMEYMLSGKPVLMYKLDGIPDEYDKYLVYFEGNKPLDIAKKIIEICEKSDCERKILGEKAREFVIREKNNLVQVGKIIKIMSKK